VIYSFGEHELDTSIFELRRNGQTLPLRHLPFRLLVHLIRRRPAAVSKAELVREVWEAAHVDDGAVRTAACDLRRALGQKGACGPWLQTVPGFGYRFVGLVEETSSSTAPTPAPLSIPTWAETDPDLAILQWLEACREALERGQRDMFALRLVHMVRIWTELQYQRPPQDASRSVASGRPAERARSTASSTSSPARAALRVYSS
jgi:DNA-binding winged helix-turn-helix (wHTH) protein